MGTCDSQPEYTSPAAQQLLRLTTAEMDAVPKFSLQKTYDPALVFSVYDGDTLTIISRLNPEGPLVKIRVRLLGVDTAELHPKKIDLFRDQTIAKARASKLYLETLCLRQLVRVVCPETDEQGVPLLDKYGRALGQVYLPDGTNVNSLMLAKGGGQAYDGGTKQPHV